MPSSQDADSTVTPEQPTSPVASPPQDNKADKPRKKKDEKKKEIDDPIIFEDVMQDELMRLKAARQMRNSECADPRDKVCDAHKDNLIGLAFSGGGIRSATFNLGILQALAQKQLLRKFDYLSTVSGGGYIGSWLAAFTRRLIDPPKGALGPRNSFTAVETALSASCYRPEERSEAPALHWLRLYSNYLTPHTGLISGDTWAMLGTWMRNTMLNQTIFALAFVSVLVLCQSVIVWLVQANGEREGIWFLGAGGFVLLLASVSMAMNVVREVSADELLKNVFQRSNITITVMLPFVISCILLNAAFWRKPQFLERSILWWAAGTAVFYFLSWGILPLFTVLPKESETAESQAKRQMISIPALLISAPVAGAVGGCLFRAYFLLLKYVAGTSWWSKDWLVIVFGSGVPMTIMLVVGMLHIGLVGRGSSDVVREWWARLGGYLKLMTMAWLLLSATCVFAPLGVLWAIFHAPRVSFATIVLWFAHNFFGLSAARSAKTSGQANDVNVKKAVSQDAAKPNGMGSGIKNALTSPKVLGVLAKIAPYVFIVGMIFILSTLVHIVTGFVFGAGYTKNLWNLNYDLQWYRWRDNYWEVLASAWAPGLALSGIGLFLAGLFLSWRVDVNDFSLHHFYRNRLVRCYLGASNPARNAEPFTGFDPDDDISLCSLADNYPGPYPILNAALNITGGEELGYATRRAKSFAFTPVYCGYERGASGKHAPRFTRDHAFRPSYAKTQQGRSLAGKGKLAADLGITLGTAMAISGAAASPNMGYHTSPATAFFMALFDVRLGWWMGNSRYGDRWGSSGPPVGFTYLFSELVAQADEKKRYVYLSDGGHFENLAIYELIRRRCRLIVACDGDADSSYEFSDLLSLIEKARTDFGVRIEIDFGTIRPAKDERECPRNFVMGKIYYDPANREDVGTLILIKASMPTKSGVPVNLVERKLPDDVWRYYEKNGTFPHQTTADQWFDELQFESYRGLGEYIGSQAWRFIDKAITEALEYGGCPGDESLESAML